MTIYPINVPPLKFYNGSDPKELRRFEKDLRTAENIEKHINRRMETDFKDRRAGMMTFGSIAAALHLKEKTVQNYLYKFSGSSDNSIEVENPKKGDD
jgi:hypothetical protein